MPIELICKKRKSPQHQDTVTIVAPERTLVLKAWDQGVLPHELVHFAVEEVFGLRGFVRLSAEGVSSDAMVEARDAEAMLAEGLTGAYQYELWGLAEASNEALVRTLRDAWDGRIVGALDARPERLERCRGRLLELAGRWLRLAPGETLELSLGGHVAD